MTEELKHSELPFSISEMAGSNILNAKGVFVAQCFNFQDNVTANAKLIVESVNNAARYKEALEAILADLTERADVDSNGARVLNIGSGVLYQARQALKED